MSKGDADGRFLSEAFAERSLQIPGEYKGKVLPILSQKVGNDRNNGKPSLWKDAVAELPQVFAR